jgi:hypothetical protein
LTFDPHPCDAVHSGDAAVRRLECLVLDLPQGNKWIKKKEGKDQLRCQCKDPRVNITSGVMKTGSPNWVPSSYDSDSVDFNLTWKAIWFP